MIVQNFPNNTKNMLIKYESNYGTVSFSQFLSKNVQGIFKRISLKMQTYNLHEMWHEWQK